MLLALLDLHQSQILVFAGLQHQHFSHCPLQTSLVVAILISEIFFLTLMQWQRVKWKCLTGEINSAIPRLALNEDIISHD